MNLAKVHRQLEELAYYEHVVFELGERHPESIDEGVAYIEGKLRKLGARLTPALLDKLRAEDADPRWLLRLCPHVPGDDWRARAARFLDDDDSEVQYWANRILETGMRR